MLSLFPIFLAWNWYVAFFFRIFLGYYFLTTGIKVLKDTENTQKQAVGILFSILGSLFVVGLYAQLCGIAGFICSFGLFLLKRRNPSFLGESVNFFILLGLVSLSLLFLGAGPYAFDLPL